ncbi:MAG: GNAT family N-acetyltransferase [Desulfurococcales archaeon]|nr:GNAT family N-acetyltransferase [Desulfurococcales archaeon]
MDQKISDEVIFRKADDKDLTNLYRLEIKCFREDAYPPQLLLFYMRFPKNFFILAEKIPEKIIIGYIIGIIEGGETGHIISICVDPGFRRRGIGSKLMIMAEKYFVEERVCISKLEVRVDNEEAMKMYKKLGYDIVDILKRYYKDGGDAYLMIKKLC